MRRGQRRGTSPARAGRALDEGRRTRDQAGATAGSYPARQLLRARGAAHRRNTGQPPGRSGHVPYLGRCWGQTRWWRGGGIWREEAHIPYEQTADHRVLTGRYRRAAVVDYAAEHPVEAADAVGLPEIL